MTRIDTIENRIDEIILVKNPPKTAIELKKMILTFNSKRQIEFENINQTFIKEHDYIFLAPLFLSENFSFEDKNITSDKLDQADFLAIREKYLNWNKREIDTMRFFIGKYDYYKE